MGTGMGTGTGTCRGHVKHTLTCEGGDRLERGDGGGEEREAGMGLVAMVEAATKVADSGQGGGGEGMWN